MNRPHILSYKSGREEFKVEAISDKKSKFIITVALEPGFLTRYVLGFIAYPHMKKMFTQKVPESLLKGVADGTLPRKAKEQ
jgi:hypothetical protein